MPKENLNNKTLTVQGSKCEDGIMYRICTKCGEEKPLSDFGLRNMGDDKDARNQPQCKKCR